jgi:catabolite regulation protein CreA
MAESSQVIGSIAGSGLVFKDTLTIESFKDPKIPAVSLYISNFQKPLTERLASGKDFFTDPSYASVGCAKTVKGKISVGNEINKTPSGEEVFEESKVRTGRLL